MDVIGKAQHADEPWQAANSEVLHMDIQMCKSGENEKAGKIITEKEENQKTEFDIKNGRQSVKHLTRATADPRHKAIHHYSQPL
ncbi:MAG: hypothetical protein V8R14_01100 [Clostridia bacterium]